MRSPFESGELSENSACANFAQVDNGKNPIKGRVTAAIAKAFGIMCASSRVLYNQESRAKRMEKLLFLCRSCYNMSERIKR